MSGKDDLLRQGGMGHDPSATSEREADRSRGGAPAIAADPRAARIEGLIGIVLRAGVLISLAVILVGSLAALIRHAGYLSSTSQFHRLTGPSARFPRTPAQILGQVLNLEGQGLIMAGILLLVATPVVRVAVSAVLFAYRKERAFALMALVVLSLLTASFMVGRAG